MRIKHLFLTIIIVMGIFHYSCNNGGNKSRIAIVKPDKIEISGDLEDYLQVIDNEYEIIDDFGGKLSIKVKALKALPKNDLWNDIKISASILGENGMPVTGTGEFEIFKSSKERVLQLLKKGSGEEVIELGSDITQYDDTKHAAKSKKFVLSSALLMSNESGSSNTSTDDKNTGTYYVNKDKVSFYITPNITSKRNAYLIKGDEVNISKIENGFGYTEYVSPVNNITTKGWVQMSEITQEYNQTDVAKSDNSLSQPEDEINNNLEYSSTDCNKFMKNYEAFINSYINLIKKYKANPTDATILSEYTEALEKVSVMGDKVALCTDTKYAVKLLELQNKLTKAVL